jgi:hypothetical protein
MIRSPFVNSFDVSQSNVGLQLRRAISIKAEKKLLEKHAIDR